MDDRIDLSRREMLQRGLVLVAAGCGLAASGELVPAIAGAATAPEKGTFTVAGRDWRSSPSGRDPGAPPGHGERATLCGELLAEDGTRAGTFRGTSFFVEGAFAGSEDAGLEFHTFSLPEGTIAGMGVAGAGASAFTVVGGTGRYAGARGTYVGEQSPLEAGGDGSATFTFRLE
jgi:hypothetical protein